MKCIEYGKENSEVVVLLHGGGLSWWNYEKAAEVLRNKYHVVLPLLDGHAGSEESFASIEENAARVIEYIDLHFGGRVALIGGLSLGGQILLEILSQRKDICRCALVESALAVPMHLTEALVGPMLDMSYGLISKPWFAHLQFRELKIRKELYNMYYADTCAISKDDMKAFLKANAGYRLKPALKSTTAKLLVIAGSRESRKMRVSVRKIGKLVPCSTTELLRGRYHGEFSINHGYEYAERIFQLLEDCN